MLGVYEGCIILLNPGHGQAIERHIVAKVEPIDELWGLPVVLANGERLYLSEYKGTPRPNWYGNGWHVSEGAQFGHLGALDGPQMPFKVLV